MMTAGDFYGKASFVEPTSVRRMVLSTIEKCNSTQLLILKCASVIQTLFDARMLDSVFPVPHDKEELLSALEELKSKGHIVMEQGKMRLRNRFVQRAIYGMMLNSQRKILHFSIGQYLRREAATSGNFEHGTETVNHFVLAGKEAEAAAEIETLMQNHCPAHIRHELEVIRRSLPSFGTKGFLIKAKTIKKGGEQKRYCLINDFAIFYHKSESEKDLAKPLGAIPLKTHRLIAHGG
jgi:hypothetical protein